MHVSIHQKLNCVIWIRFSAIISLWKIRCVQKKFDPTIILLEPHSSPVRLVNMNMYRHDDTTFGHSDTIDFGSNNTQRLTSYDGIHHMRGWWEDFKGTSPCRDSLTSPLASLLIDIWDPSAPWGPWNNEGFPAEWSMNGIVMRHYLLAVTVKRGRLERCCELSIYNFRFILESTSIHFSSVMFIYSSTVLSKKCRYLCLNIFTLRYLYTLHFVGKLCQYIYLNHLIHNHILL